MGTGPSAVRLANRRLAGAWPIRCRPAAGAERRTGWGCWQLTRWPPLAGLSCGGARLDWVVAAIGADVENAQVSDIPLWTTLLIFVTVCLWLVYGLLPGHGRSSLQNLLSASVVGVLLAAKILWEKP